MADPRLTFSTLFPNNARPNHGVFVENRLRHLVASGEATARSSLRSRGFPCPHPWFGDWAVNARVVAPRDTAWTDDPASAFSGHPEGRHVARAGAAVSRDGAGDWAADRRGRAIRRDRRALPLSGWRGGGLVGPAVWPAGGGHGARHRCQPDPSIRAAQTADPAGDRGRRRVDRGQRGVEGSAGRNRRAGRESHRAAQRGRYRAVSPARRSRRRPRRLGRDRDHADLRRLADRAQRPPPHHRGDDRVARISIDHRRRGTGTRSAERSDRAAWAERPGAAARRPPACGIAVAVRCRRRIGAGVVAGGLGQCAAGIDGLRNAGGRQPDLGQSGGRALAGGRRDHAGEHGRRCGRGRAPAVRDAALA